MSEVYIICPDFAKYTNNSLQNIFSLAFRHDLSVHDLSKFMKTSFCLGVLRVLFVTNKFTHTITLFVSACFVLDIDYANSWKQCFSVLHLCCKLIVYSVVLLFSTEQRHFVRSRYPRRQTHMSLWNLNRVASIHFADTVPVYWVLTTNIHWYKSL